MADLFDFVQDEEWESTAVVQCPGQESFLVDPSGAIVEVVQDPLLEHEDAGLLFDVYEACGLEKQEWTGGTGTLLQAITLNTDAPKHPVKRGDVYRLAGRHTLYVVDLICDFMAWVPTLANADARTLFVPYPDPFITITQTAQVKTLVMVQPEEYLGGHLLDRHAEAYGEDSIECLMRRA